MKITVRITDNSRTAVVRRGFDDKVPSKAELDACVTEALAELNYETAKPARKKTAKKTAKKST
jgi:hypothetical protein